ncbi:MAG: MmgE/PrpD family protein [Dehalococcoidia bacterium]|nr:MmgE/PrpD family protein [Dehalococcoidia bacterium]
MGRWSVGRSARTGATSRPAARPRASWWRTPRSRPACRCSSRRLRRAYRLDPDRRRRCRSRSGPRPPARSRPRRRRAARSDVRSGASPLSPSNRSGRPSVPSGTSSSQAWPDHLMPTLSSWDNVFQNPPTYVSCPPSPSQEYECDSSIQGQRAVRRRRCPLSATQSVVDFIHDTPAGKIPAEARENGRRALLDTIGVTLAGVDEPSARVVRSLVEREGGEGVATLLGTNVRAPLAAAALANGTAGHALDYDDVTANVTGHPSIPLMPAVLAVGESVGASGADVVAAFLVGFEVECKVGRAMGRSHYARGFHSTTTLGALGSAAAAVRLLRLDRGQTGNALGIASSMAGGLRANFGSMTKPLQAGNAARAGVVAALLAQEGFTGGDDILDGPFGFVRAFSPAEDGDIEQVGGFGDPWEVVSPGISVKKYPCCFVSHRAADATLALISEHGIGAEQVERVEVHLPNGQVSATGGVGPMIHPRPQTGLEGKFSMQYVVASALLDGEVKFPNFDDRAVARPAAQALLRRVEPMNDTQRHPAATTDQYTAVDIHTTDDRVLSRAVTEARGGPADPLSWDELLDKYRDCAARALPAEQVERSAQMLRDLEAVADIRELTATLATGTAVAPV